MITRGAKSWSNHKSTIEPPGGLFIPNTFEEEGLNTDEGAYFRGGGGGGGYLLSKVVLQKELPYKVDRLRYKKLEVMQGRIKNKSELLVDENHPRSVHTKFYSHD